MRNAIQLIKEYNPRIDALAERLLSDNHLTGDETGRMFEDAERIIEK